MIALLLVAPLLSPGVTMTKLTPVSAECGKRWKTGNLHAFYEKRAWKCAAPGQCGPAYVADDDAQDIKLYVEGCDAPLPGRFVETGQRCTGPKLRKFTGKVPPGRYLMLRAVGTMHGWFRSPGLKKPFQCPAAPPRQIARR